MKKSDKKQYEKAWEGYLAETKDLIVSLDTLIELPECELRVEEINSITMSVGKLAKSVRRVCEQHQMKIEEI